MRVLTNHFQNSITDANGKKGAQHPQQANKIISILLFCFLLSVSASLNSQVQYAAPDVQSSSIAKENKQTQTAVVSNPVSCFLPVYFNFSRRQLKYNGIRKMDPAVFLTMCRSIKDSAVQEQVARYDGYTKEKQKLGVAVLGCGFLATGMLGGVAANDKGSPEFNMMLAFTGMVALIAIPVIGIYSGTPHKKRKAVLFRDLPIAYNLFVESQQLNPECASIIHP